MAAAVLATGLHSVRAADVTDSFLVMFKPLPAEASTPDNECSEAKTDLGRMLYYDKRFSKNQDISCNSCHMLDKYGTDNAAFSSGHKGQKGGRSAPTVYNAALHIAQFWDGRAPTVEEQAKGPVLNPIEMAMPDKDHVIKVIKSIPGYADAFKKAFPGEADPITYDNFGKAVGAFERKLLTPSRWDHLLEGQQGRAHRGREEGICNFRLRRLRHLSQRCRRWAATCIRSSVSPRLGPASRITAALRLRSWSRTSTSSKCPASATSPRPAPTSMTAPSPSCPTW